MALYHFSVTQVKRSEGHTAIAAAAYRSGEKLYDRYYGEVQNYTKKRRRGRSVYPFAGACSETAG